MNEKRKKTYDLAYMAMARIWAKQSYANKLKVGCLIVKDQLIISDGFNGVPSGLPNRCEGPDGHTLDTVIHAEANAITKLARMGSSSEGATAYITAAPCMSCSKLLIQAGIKRVVFNNPWKHSDGLELLKKVGVLVEQI